MRLKIPGIGSVGVQAEALSLAQKSAHAWGKCERYDCCRRDESSRHEGDERLGRGLDGGVLPDNSQDVGR